MSITDINHPHGDADLRCPVSGGPVFKLGPRQPGYLDGMFFDIMYSPTCQLKFASPLQINPEIYEKIYRQSANLPGYDRYQRYVELCAKSQKPLDDLAFREETYWAVREAVKKFIATRAPSDDAKLKILEVGSGLGYLTFSLRCAGHDVLGLDISVEAVQQATNRFGHYYRAGTLADFKQNSSEIYDIIIATEIIEHLVDPNSFIQQARDLLRTGGMLVLTTPNMEMHSRQLVWNTDAPPIHLFWFSEGTFHYWAAKFDFGLEFIDYSSCYGQSFASDDRITTGAVLNASAEIFATQRPIFAMIQRFLYQRPRLHRYKRNMLMKIEFFIKVWQERNRRSGSICACLTKLSS